MMSLVKDATQLVCKMGVVTTRVVNPVHTSLYDVAFETLKFCPPYVRSPHSLTVMENVEQDQRPPLSDRDLLLTRYDWKQHTTCTPHGDTEHGADWGQWEPRCWLLELVNPTNMITYMNPEACTLPPTITFTSNSYSWKTRL